MPRKQTKDNNQLVAKTPARRTRKSTPKAKTRKRA